VLEKINLSNGAVLLCEPVAGAEVVAAGLWFLHGSRDEGPDEQGFSHFLEHMVFKGTSRRTARDIAIDIDRVGGVLNAATEKEVTSIYASVPREHFAVVLDVICDIDFGATLPEGEIEKEKLVVENEISSIEDSPEEKGYELFVETIWSGHPLASKITGTAESVRAITREKLEVFYRRFFTPGRLVISLAGGLETDAAAAAVEAKIAELASRAGDRTVEQAAPPRTAPGFLPASLIRDDEFSQAQIYYARPFPLPRKMKDYYHHLLLSTAFGESMSSRLFQNIREEEGLCYSVYSTRTYYSDCALFMVHASTLPEQVPALLKSLDRELGRLADESLTRKEIDEARLQVKGGLVLGKQDAEVRMKRMARQYIAMDEINTYEESFRLIESVTEDDIGGLIHSLFSESRPALLLYGCPGLGRAEAVLRQLPRLAATGID
jgi:predicted Zn-dependent peptidase